MIKGLLKRSLGVFGYELRRKTAERPADFSEQDQDLIDWVKPFTLTTPERLLGLIRATEYLVANRIPGAFVECGVWRGGSMMAVARRLKELNCVDRDLYLYDTFEGMPTPSDHDVSMHGEVAVKSFTDMQGRADGSQWCLAGLDEVRANMALAGYPARLIHYVKGKVEDTVPQTVPAQIALLRLDTDWYESTRHELEYLWPLLSPQGVLILDDYGYWKGARKAVDDFLATLPFKPLLNRLDHTGRLLIKPANGESVALARAS